MRNVSDKSCRVNLNTKLKPNNFSGNCVLYEIISKNILDPDRPQMTTWRMRIACWITKATHTHIHTHTHSEYIMHTIFSTTTMVTRTRLGVTLRVQCLFS